MSEHESETIQCIVHAIFLRPDELVRIAYYTLQVGEGKPELHAALWGSDEFMGILNNTAWMNLEYTGPEAA